MSPAYGEVWAAMHIALVYDALQRLPLLDKEYAATALSNGSLEVEVSLNPGFSSGNRSSSLNEKKRRFEDEQVVDKDDDPALPDNHVLESIPPERKRRRTLSGVALRDEVGLIFESKLSK